MTRLIPVVVSAGCGYFVTLHWEGAAACAVAASLWLARDAWRERKRDLKTLDALRARRDPEPCACAWCRRACECASCRAAAVEWTEAEEEFLSGQSEGVPW